MNKQYFYNYEGCKKFIKDLMELEYIFPNHIKIYKRRFCKDSNLKWVVAFDLFSDKTVDNYNLLDM